MTEKLTAFDLFPYYLLFQKCSREQCALECTFTLSVLISSKVLFGYRRKRSTVDAIIQIIEKIRDDDQFLCSCLFLDLSKAFDTLDHERLIMKLERYGIRGPALKWFKSYCEGRKQFVLINGTMSQPKVLSTCVPQGLILGPLLFLIYMNGLEDICTFLLPTFFADDTNLKIFTSKANYNEDQINFELPLSKNGSN